MALNITQEVSAIENIGIVRDKRGEIIRLTFGNPVNVDLCIHDGNIVFIAAFPEGFTLL